MSYGGRPGLPQDMSGDFDSANRPSHCISFKEALNINDLG